VRIILHRDLVLKLFSRNAC